MALLLFRKSLSFKAPPEKILEIFEKVKEEFTEKDLVYQNLKITKKKVGGEH